MENKFENKKICAVIPAAGRGSRLGVSVPKIFVPVTQSKTIWDILFLNLFPFVDFFHLILSRDGEKFFASHNLSRSSSLPLNYSLQEKPLGMGDAIFKGTSTWSRFDRILVVWGDQVSLSPTTIRKVTQELRTCDEQTLIIPTCRPENLYVEYVFKEGRLVRILQKREGDLTSPGGFSDVGVFGLTTQGLESAWQRYLVNMETGKETAEVNFLPFLVYLSQQEDWKVKQLPVEDPEEAIGVNTPEDLNRVRQRFEIGV